MLVSDEEEAVNLEHILPRNPSGPWGGIDPDTAESLCRRIGNMVLLKAKANSEIERKEYCEKRPVMRKSVYVLTKKAAEDYDQWGADQINERQKKLAKLAVRTWPRTL
jgi:hypothetical protein